jgi:DNA polymerase-3 subunit gamma/tau
VESFKKRFAETAKKTEAGYLISALNILAEAEINFKAARNKRLHVELALIKLCYLQQALQITTEGGHFEKTKLTQSARSVAFKSIAPIAVKIVQSTPVPATIQVEIPNKEPKSEAKLIIETPALKEKVPEVKEPKLPYTPVAKTTPAPKSKLGSLEALRQQFNNTACGETVADKPLELESLKKAWLLFIEQLKEAKNPAWQSFELAELIIKDASRFEATASNNLQQKFLELERNKACEYLQKELCNKTLQFSILLVEGLKEMEVVNRPLSSKEQYLKIIEQYPLVKELRERLGLELDY